MKNEWIRPFQYDREFLRTLERNEPKRKMRASNTAATLWQLWGILRLYRARLLAITLFIVASSAFALLGPFVVGYAVDHYLVTGQFNQLLPVVGALIVIYLGHSLATWYQASWMIDVSQRTVYTMRLRLFEQFHRLSISFFDKRQHGELMSRVTNDIENVSSTLNSSLIQVLSSVLTLVGTVGIMLYCSPLLTALTMTIIPLMFYAMKWITDRTGPIFKIQQRHLGELNGFIQETMSGQRIIKTFSQEERVLAEFKAKSEKLKLAGFWAQAISGNIPKVMNTLNNLSFAIIAGVGGVLALKGMVTIGTIVIFAEYARQFTRPLNDLANQFNTILSAVAGAERVFDILAQPAEEEDEVEATSLANVQGRVEFRDVSFAYDEGGDTIDDVSFIVEPGEVVALVGPTGAGKTTLINLLTRFYTQTAGAIYLDGHDHRTVTRQSLREQMAFVLQDSYLFHGTVRENIRYGRLTATDEEVEAAAREANADSFIQRLPHGYDTVLASDGGGISQGQRQLLAIARAMVANPKILILDEATSNIDTITELHIQQALKRLMDGRTAFVIAHRLNTIRDADHIIVLQHGRTTEQGTHDELMEQQGFYATLHGSSHK